MLRRVSKLVDYSGSTTTRPGRDLVHETVALEESEVGTDRVVCDPQSLTEIFDGPTAPPKLGDNLTSGGHEELAAPLHDLRYVGEGVFSISQAIS